MTRFVRTVHLLSPTNELKAPVHLVEELTHKPNVDIDLGAALRAVLGSEHVEGVRYAQRGAGEHTLPVTGAFIYLQGARPITDFLGGAALRQRWRLPAGR